jgi:hypothetical protein
VQRLETHLAFAPAARVLRHHLAALRETHTLNRPGGRQRLVRKGRRHGVVVAVEATLVIGAQSGPAPPPEIGK